LHGIVHAYLLGIISAERFEDVKDKLSKCGGFDENTKDLDGLTYKGVAAKYDKRMKAYEKV
jgi:hypothetical protein